MSRVLQMPCSLFRLSLYCSSMLHLLIKVDFLYIFYIYTFYHLETAMITEYIILKLVMLHTGLSCQANIYLCACQYTKLSIATVLRVCLLHCININFKNLSHCGNARKHFVRWVFWSGISVLLSVSFLGLAVFPQDDSDEGSYANEYYYCCNTWKNDWILPWKEVGVQNMITGYKWQHNNPDGIIREQG